MFSSRVIPKQSDVPFHKQFFGTFRYTNRAIGLVWSTSKPLTIAMVIMTLFAGVLPAATAYVGKLIVDGVVLAAQTGSRADLNQALVYVGLECGLMVIMAGGSRGLTVAQSLLRALLGQRVNVMILEKALTLELKHFEDSEFYDRLTQARREASSRPLSLVNRTFSLIQNGISLISYGGLLLSFSPWAVLVLMLAGLPLFFAETHFSNQAFRLFQWRSPETRKRAYLEMVMAREDYVKEVQLFKLGGIMLQRFKDIFHMVFAEDRSLIVRRGFWGFALGLLSTFAFYGAYGWIVWSTASGQITLGDMTMYLMVFRQGQSAFAAGMTSIGGMYEDNLYLSKLYQFLEERTAAPSGTALQGPSPGGGVRFEDVWFTYPGAEEPAIQGVSFHLQPGEKLALVGENGSGKTTLIKLLTRLYTPDSGRILLDGLDIEEWQLDALRERIGVIFQDFVRFQFTVGENIGSGDVHAYEDHARWRNAADKGMATPFIDKMDKQFDTQLGRWFEGGRELSGGQWQKIALSRAFMRVNADILVLDEPTAAMDAEAEVRIFDHFREVTRRQMAILISHRFSTVRMADQIAVLNAGKLVEQGTHEELMALDGRYAHLFRIQAAGYQ
ncbi:MAG: ABC transporter ATP-binding protein [Acidobacteriota bacterium]|nr:ABC transporter ATP-binding protein [Acidobacteriota bacterium]